MLEPPLNVKFSSLSPCLLVNSGKLTGSERSAVNPDHDSLISLTDLWLCPYVHSQAILALVGHVVHRVQKIQGDRRDGDVSEGVRVARISARDVCC